MRYALLSVVMVFALMGGCGSSPYCTGNGASTACSGNGQGGGPQSSSAPIALHNVPNVSYVGAYLAGTTGSVTQAQIRANVYIALNGSVGQGAGRNISVCDPQPTSCLAFSYIDIMRPDAFSLSGLGTAMQDDSGFQEGCSGGGGTGVSWFLHASCGPPVRTTTATNVFNTNFANLATAAWTKLCLTAQINAITNPRGATTCNSQSVGRVGDSNIGDTLDHGDGVFSDTPAIDIQNLTGSASVVEIANDNALQIFQAAWYPVAFQHSTGQAYSVWTNGTDRGANKGELSTNAHSCHYVQFADCLILVGYTPTVYGGFEFFCQNIVSSKLAFAAEYCPFGVNSATNVISAGKSFIPASESECYPGGCGSDPAGTVETTANHMMLYYAMYLLTYQPSAPYSEIESLDVERHVTTGGNTNNSNNLASWPVQTVVPNGRMAIGITNYVQGGAGYAGCPAPDTNNSGGIIPYLVPSSCGKGDDTVTDLGVYGNASSDCRVALVDIGPCAWYANPTNATYNTSLCLNIAALGTDLSLVWGASTFQHQVDIGQVAATLGDVIPSGQGGGGGTITYNVQSFACATPQIPSDGAIIITP